MLRHCNSKRWHAATIEALSSGRPGTTDARQIEAEHSLRQNAEHARVSDLAAVPICCPHSSNAPDQRCECSGERRRLAAAHGVQIGDHCAKNKLPSFDRRGQHRHRKDRGARDFYPARADKMCRWDMNMIHGPVMINTSSSTSVIMFPFLYTRRCRESRA